MYLDNVMVDFCLYKKLGAEIYCTITLYTIEYKKY